jgi:hypothetical protein
MHRPISLDSATTMPEHPQQPLFDTIGATLAHTLERQEPSRPSGPPTGRDAHPKHHGCVTGTFTVEADLPPALRVGVCREPGRQFDVWIRFSNAFKRRHDLTWDARGIAIKLLDVADTTTAPDPQAAEAQATQDFLLVSHPEFFSRTAEDFLDFPAAVAAASSFAALASGIFPYFFGWRPSKWRWRGFLALLGSFKWIDNPLGIAYFSQVPYRFGTDRAKYCVRPQQPSAGLRQPRFLLLVAAYVCLSLVPRLRDRFDRWANMLQTALLEHLRQREARFDFMVQIGTETMPIDDAVVRWDERRAPFTKVATITIGRLPDPFDLDEMMRIGEHLSFTPWHNLPEHEPLGSINACRRHVYQRISDLRHRLNHRMVREPRSGETAAEYLDAIGD